MAKILLRSGSLDDYQAVGENGQSVFDSALQIRETLRLRKQQALVDCLAIPQINDDGDRVDWYAPFPGSVRGWAAADSDTRERALKSLEKTIAGALTLSKRCMQSDKAAQVRFGALLAKALQFPGSNHVYLVDDRAVITFWGFVNLNEGVADDVLACLAIEEPEEPAILAEPEPAAPEPVTITLSEPDAPLLAPAPPPTPAPSPVPAATPSVGEPLVYTPYPVNPAPAAAPQPAVTPAPQPAPAARKKSVPLWALPVAAVVVAAVAVPAVWVAMNPAPTAVAAVEPAPVTPVAIAPAPVKEAPALTASLPLHPAKFTPAVTPVVEAPPAPVVIEPPPKDALVMDADQVRNGSTKFLNGNWRVDVDFRDPVSGKVPALRYQVTNNKGQTTVTLRGKVTCKAEVFSGLHSDGTLMIKTRGAARCSDGARYNVPEIACKATENNAAQCTGQYDEKTVVPVTFKKVSA
ncbi:SrfA family protein [Siccibacter turicensis]|uniref:SrfA family protein n=1 Tax=Siccibacter turicensis TaxID=357233 RepID=UPI003F567AD2